MRMPSPVAIALLVVYSYTLPMPPVAMMRKWQCATVRVSSPASFLRSSSTEKPVSVLRARLITVNSEMVTFGRLTVYASSPRRISAPVESR